MFGEVGRHHVYVIGEILPRSRNSRDLGLSAELAFRADIAGHAGDFASECVELVHHGINGVLQLQNFALHVHGNFARQVALRDGGCHFGDVSNLAGKISGHRVYRIGKILPGSRDAGHVGLAS